MYDRYENWWSVFLVKLEYNTIYDESRDLNVGGCFLVGCESNNIWIYSYNQDKSPY